MSYLENVTKRRLVTNRVTLRLPNSILQVLKDQADKKDIPLNALITKILSRNIAFDTNINAVPNLTIPYFLFSRILDNVDDASIDELSKIGPGLVKKLFMIMGARYELAEVIESYFTMQSKYCGWFKFSYETQIPNYRLVFEVEQDSDKWTRFLAAYTKCILDSIGNTHIESQVVNDNVIIFVLRHYGR